MLRTIDYTQLDDETKAYLGEVRASNGQGAPGVFMKTSSGYSVLAFLAGLVILPLFVWAGYSSNKPAWANAMIQTAGVLLGGWLMLYAIRRWLASPNKYVGKFFYFDPDHVYIGEGEQLKYAPFDDETTVVPVGPSSVRVETSDSRFDVPVSNRGFAVYVANYYDALRHLRTEEPDWSNLSSAESGAVAKYMVQNDRLPNDLSDVELSIDKLPDEVHPKRGGGFGFLRYLLILVIGAGAFVAFTLTNKPIRDEANFADVKDGGPAKLRDYLLNPYNEKYRDEVTKLLAQKYDAPIQMVRDKATDAELKEGFIKLLDTLRGPEAPAVSLSVKDQDDHALSSWADSLRTRFADGIGNAIGIEHIVFVRKPDDKPALLDITYASTNPNRITWTVELRLKADDPQPYLKVSRTTSLTANNPSGLPLQPTEAVYQDVMMKMVGTAPAAPPPLPLEDW
jgi:hypothetical protein